jgi:hypothetical protein
MQKQGSGRWIHGGGVVRTALSTRQPSLWAFRRAIAIAWFSQQIRGMKQRNFPVYEPAGGGTPNFMSLCSSSPALATAAGDHFWLKARRASACTCRCTLATAFRVFSSARLSFSSSASFFWCSFSFYASSLRCAFSSMAFKYSSLVIIMDLE